MTSTAISAQGSKFSVGAVAEGGGDPTYTQVKNVKSFSGFDGTATELDATDLDSTAKEKLLGLMDEGSFSIDINTNMADPGQAALKAGQRSSAKLPFKLETPDGYSYTFNGYVKSFPLQGGVDAILATTVQMTITGSVTETPPAGA
ncbi:phage tail tube protein [Paraburkholderia atlantica]|uniref:phage tail tube protein n=1 Tax=Paraburkholderia atlantica TaxID=2654982 RepID=UPI00036239C3|nr:phage tail tube protein [Paraburkholderia atlantica]